MAATIPEDVVFQILVWLPVASLLRFKSVCKSWRSLIDSSSFISQHTHHGCLSDSVDHKLIVLNSDIRPYFYFSINFVSVSHLQLFKYIEFSPTDELHRTDELHSVRRLRGARLVASFNGLICLRYQSESYLQYTDRLIQEDVVSLWNPATTQFTILPPGHSDSHCEEVIEYGFGFDVQTNDYKVVRVSSGHHMESFRSRVEVYSLSMGCWRVIDTVLPLDIHITCNPRQPFRNEIYCWSGIDQISKCSLILSFDLSKEVFGIMQVPDVCSHASEDTLYLAFLRGKIACIQWIYDHSERQNDHCKIWVLNQYGVKESWTNPYTIMLGRAYIPRGFSMDGNLILINGYKEEKLRLCDPLTQEVKEVPTQGRIFEAAVYKESLLSFKNATGVTKRVVYEDLSKKIQDLPDPWDMLSQEDDLVP